MTQTEILHEFKQMSIRQQLETLRAALEIVEKNFEASQKEKEEGVELVETAAEDSLLAMAGMFEAPMTDISERHDHYIGENVRNGCR